MSNYKLPSYREFQIKEQAPVTTATSVSPAEFFGKLLGSVTVTHMLHLASRSYSQHMALGAYYGGVPVLIDGVVEQYMGINGLIANWPAIQCEQPQDASQYMGQLLDFVKANRGVVGSDSNIQNDIDTIVALIASTKYKLDNLR